MIELSGEVLLDGLTFGECPRWHDDALWFSDFFTNTVRRATLDGASSVVCEVAGQPSGLGWLPDGRMLVVSMHDRRVLRREHTGALVTHADLSGIATFHCNDMVVDTRGRAYVGNFGWDLYSDPEARTPATLALVEPDGSARAAAGGLVFPNGAVITPDGRTLVVAESFAQRLSAFDIADDGSLSNRRVWAELGEVLPDGICLDAEGAIWVASPMTGTCERVLEGGRVTHKVAPGMGVFACMLGGPAGHHLFLVEAPSFQPEEAARLRAGRIEVLEVAVPHAGCP